jgi:hypothetical protein
MLNAELRERSMLKKKAIILVFGVLLFFHFLAVAEVLSPLSFGETWPIRPPVCPGDPPAIPDSPFIEGLNLKQPYNLLERLLVTEAFCSRPGSCNWNPEADLNFDKAVDILDAIIVAKNC